MIYATIIILVIIMVALVVDWSKITKKIGLKINNSNLKKPTNRNFLPETTQVLPPIEPRENLSSNQGILKHKCKPEVEEILSKADIHFRKGEMKAAEELYIKAASEDARCGKAYSRLGVIYLEHEENLTDAEEAFRQALKIESDNGYIMNNLGLVLYYQDRYADAIRQFEMAVRQDEYNAGRHANLGMAYLAMRQFVKAESSFKRALKLAPNEAEYKDLLNEAMEKKKAHRVLLKK